MRLTAFPARTPTAADLMRTSRFDLLWSRTGDLGRIGRGASNPFAWGRTAGMTRTFQDVLIIPADSEMLSAFAGRLRLNARDHAISRSEVREPVDPTREFIGADVLVGIFLKGSRRRPALGDQPQLLPLGAEAHQQARNLRNLRHRHSSCL